MDGIHLRPGRPLLGASGRHWAGWVLACCAVLVAVPGVLFARQATADRLDHAIDSPVISGLGGHYHLLLWLAAPGTAIPHRPTWRSGRRVDRDACRRSCMLSARPAPARPESARAGYRQHCRSQPRPRSVRRTRHRCMRASPLSACEPCAAASRRMSMTARQSATRDHRPREQYSQPRTSGQRSRFRVKVHRADYRRCRFRGSCSS